MLNFDFNVVSLLLFFQLIDLSMSVSDDPKEPYFFSVLPWIILYRIIKHEEAAFDCMLRQHISIGDDEGLLTSYFRACTFPSVLMHCQFLR